MIQTCLSGSYGLILILCGPRPHGMLRQQLVVLRPLLDQLAVAIDDEDDVVKRRSQPRFAAGSHVAHRPSSLPVAMPRDGLSIAYGVHGFAPCGQRQLAALRDPDAVGVSAKTRPPIPTSSRRGNDGCPAAAWASSPTI